MRAVEAAFVLFLIASVLWAVHYAWKRIREHYRIDHAKWKLVEHSDGEGVQVIAEKHGEKPMVVETEWNGQIISKARFGDEDFESQLYLLQSAGREKIYAAN